jgi:HlyD family secretion protein
VAQPTETTPRKARSFPVRRVAVVAVLAIVGVAWFFLARHDDEGGKAFTGYVVSDNIYMTAPAPGTLTEVAVRRGDRVAAGQLLFRIDPAVRAAETDRARAQISGAEAGVAQQEAALSRARADLSAAQADADRGGVEAARLAAAQREKPGSVAQLQLALAQAAHKAALGRRDAARAALRSASAAISASRAQVRQAEASLASARSQLDDLAPVSPAAGRIEEIMFKPGESVAAGAPVVAIVPDGEVKVRFYVPETRIADFKPGRRLAIACDGCASGLTATVEFVASRPEYTPPVIYSLDARSKLVFMVEAVPAKPDALVPGQPMDVAGLADELPRR